MYLLGCWLYTTASYMILDLQLEDLQNVGLCDVAYKILLLPFSSYVLIINIFKQIKHFN